MKKLLILPLLLAFQIVSAQWNAIGWNPFTLRSTSGDSTFVLSAPSRVDLQKWTASWVPERQDSYLVYTALFNQQGTNDPTPTVLYNTIGDIQWTRESENQYWGTLSGAFVDQKTVLIPSAGSYLAIKIGETGSWKFIRIDSDTVEITTTDTEANDYLDNASFFIEIRVYP